MKTKLERIQECFEIFYRDLYSQPDAAGEDRIDAFLNNLDLPSLSDVENENLTKPISTEEINAAITRLKLGKAVGPDGYNSQWYRILRTELVPLLLKTFNHALRRQKSHPLGGRPLFQLSRRRGKTVKIAEFTDQLTFST